MHLLLWSFHGRAGLNIPTLSEVYVQLLLLDWTAEDIWWEKPNRIQDIFILKSLALCNGPREHCRTTIRFVLFFSLLRQECWVYKDIAEGVWHGECSFGEWGTAGEFALVKWIQYRLPGWQRKSCSQLKHFCSNIYPCTPNASLRSAWQRAELSLCKCLGRKQSSWLAKMLSYLSQILQRYLLRTTAFSFSEYTLKPGPSIAFCGFYDSKTESVGHSIVFYLWS